MVCQMYLIFCNKHFCLCKNEISYTALIFVVVLYGQSIVFIYFRSQTSARTQPPNKVLSSAAMIVSFAIQKIRTLALA